MKHWLLSLALLMPAMAARAQGHMHAHPAPACEGVGLACASAATPAFAADGTLWLTWAANDRVLVARSADKGATFAAPVAVTPEPERLDNGPDSRPRIVVDASGRITVAYAVFRDKNWNGEVKISRSTDAGAHFSAPEPITGGSPSQRFQSMEIDSDGRVFAAWLDKRNVAAARAKGEDYAGAAFRAIA